jgi:hypothetical protein
VDVRQVPAFKTKSPAAMRHILLPSNIVMTAFIATWVIALFFVT